MVHSQSEIDREWDDFVASNPHGYHEQSSLYAALRKEFGYDCLRSILRDDAGTIIGGAQVLYQATPAGRLGLVLRGPVASGDDPDIFARVVAQLEDLAWDNFLASIRVETFPAQKAAWDALSAAGYCPSTAWTDKIESSFVDLTMSDDEILASLPSATRNQVRGARRKGVEVMIGGKDDVPDFYDMLVKTAEYQGFPVFPMNYFTYMQEVFGPDCAPIFIAKHDGKPISAVMCFVTGNRLYYCWGGMDRDPGLRKLNANRLLHFEAMRWGHAMGLDAYDLTGSNFFKNQLGHNTVTWPPVLRRHFGPGKAVHRSIVEGTSRSETLRALVSRGARRLGYQRRMPY